MRAGCSESAAVGRHVKNVWRALRQKLKFGALNIDLEAADGDPRSATKSSRQIVGTFMPCRLLALWTRLLALDATSPVS